MKQGVLYFNKNSNRFDIRFDINDYYGGLYCGDSFEVFADGKWTSTRIEMNYETSEWYLVGILSNDLNGLIVRI